MEQVDCQAIAGDFKRSPHKGVQALFHADHWQFSDAQAGNEPSLDRLHTARRMARAQGWRSPRARPATLPLGYLESLLSGLSENPRIRLHHFGNVEIDPPCEGEDPRARCAREYTAWAESLTEGRRDASQIHIFVQFNTDSAPGAVDEVLEMQRRLGIPYSLLTFARWTSHSAGREETYPLNWTAIAEDVEQDIASVGYLHNGLHLSRGDIQQAAGDMDADIATLKALGCDIRVFQPWGSNMPSSDMVHTVHVDWWKMTKSQPLWIYNRFGLSFDATFSDASLANPASATIELDPVHWCKEKLKPGHRYLLMLHPHLYETNWDKPAVIEGPEWYQKICKARSMAGWNKLTSRVRKL